MFDVVALLRRNKSVQYEFDWFFGDRKFINYSNALLKVICYNYKTLNVFSKKQKKSRNYIVEVTVTNQSNVLWFTFLFFLSECHLILTMIKLLSSEGMKQKT